MPNSEIYDSNGLRERIVDNGDGTGTRTTYDSEGNVTGTEELTGLPIPVDPEPTDAERIADLEAALNALAGGGE